ncbi:SPJ_0845 family protein [Enterococcus lactis]
MGLKFERTDNLDKLFESFAVDPEKTVAPKEEIDRFLKPQPQKEKKKTRNKSKISSAKKTYQPNFYGRV